MNNLLTEREYTLNDDKVNWYSALKFLRNYESVIDAEWWDTTSSAGDWSGFLVQKINGKNYLIPISQENRYPYWGYKLYTSDEYVSWKGDYKREDAYKIYDELCKIWEG